MAGKTAKLVNVKAADPVVETKKESSVKTESTPAPVKPVVTTMGTAPITEKPAQTAPQQSPPAIAVRASTDPTIEQSAEFKASIDKLVLDFLAKRPNAVTLGARPTMPENKVIQKMAMDRIAADESLDLIDTIDSIRAEFAGKIRDYDAATQNGAPILSSWLKYTVNTLQESILTVVAANPGALSGKIARIASATPAKVKTAKASSESSGTRSSNAEINGKIIAYAKDHGLADCIVVNNSPDGLGHKTAGFVRHTAYRPLADGTYQIAIYNVADGSVTVTDTIVKSWKDAVKLAAPSAALSLNQLSNMSLLTDPSNAKHADRIVSLETIVKGA